MLYIILVIIVFSFLESFSTETMQSNSDQKLISHAIEKRKNKREYAAIIDNYFNQVVEISHSKKIKKDPFVTETEISELQIPWLIDTLDYTQTAFGRRLLEQSMQLATSDSRIIKERQRIESILYDNSDVLQKIQNTLYLIGSLQGHFLSYFDPADRLHLIAQSLYFNGDSIEWISSCAKDIIKKGNNHTKILNLGIIGSIIKRCDSFFISLCKQSMADELIKITLGISTQLNLDGFLFENMVSIFKDHILWFRSFNPETYNGDHHIYSNIMREGTFADKVGAYVCGSTAQDTSIGFKYIPISWRWNLRKQSDFTSWQTVPWYSKAIAVLSLFGWTLYKDYRTIEDGKESIKKISNLFKVMGALRSRLQSFSQIIYQIKGLLEFIKKYPEIYKSSFIRNLELINTITGSSKFNELSKLLDAIGSYKNNGDFYNYGVVLKAHALLHEIKHEFIPIFEAIGELDAYCSVATLCKQHQKKTVQFSFVEFVEKDEPYVWLQNCWVPLISPSKVVSNDIYLGANNWGNKIIITGPNGGGKSTYLKALGQSIYLAHTFGIAPASHAIMTLYSGLRTCFHPKENLSENMSQFMAEKKSIDALASYVQDNISINQKKMLLIDEPYRGTVDSESAERIYTFGKLVAHNPLASVVIATHVYKPITLSDETDGIFTNCQVVIDQVDTDYFKRTFTVAPGVATWWFSDANKRSHFIDWLAGD